MADDIERLCNAAYEAGRRHHVAYGGCAVSIETIRAIMVGALHEIDESMASAYPDAGRMARELLFQAAEGGQKQ